MAHSTERAHVRYPIEIHVDLESEHNFYSGITGDISEGGLFVATWQLPEIGETLELKLTLPGFGDEILVRGNVRWVREVRAANEGVSPGFGMEWNDLNESQLAAIRRFSCARDSIFYEAA